MQLNASLNYRSGIIASDQTSVLKTQNKYFWAGLLLYAVSFFLIANGRTSSFVPSRGYLYALDALAVPLEELWLRLHGVPFDMDRLELLFIFLSGLINPLFLLTTIVALAPGRRHLFVVLRTIVVLLLPFCWVVFCYERMHPREGYFLWTLAMLLTMFSSRPDS